ncbi:MAG: type 4a pilus biogenesis protein PilO [Gemmatimonadetes bacterium]|nr:type 4a pilus biogenesis protein PilO [Gemmatimonadota bacterium]
MALIPDDPKQQKALMAIAVSLVVLYFANSLWYSGAVETIEAEEERVENLAAQNRTAQALAISAGRGLEDRMALIERHVAELEQLIPSSEEVASVVNQMSQVARDVGVSEPSIRPDAVVQGEVYAQQAFQIRVLGEYHDVGRFLAGLASLPRIITPSDLQLVPFVDPSGTMGFDAPVEVNFRIQTYLAPDRVEVPPAE